MSEKKRGLGRGLGALIPTSGDNDRPVDVFFPDNRSPQEAAATKPSLLSHGAREVLQAPPRRRASTDTPDNASAVPPVGDQPRARQGGTRRQTAPESELVPVPGARFAEIPTDAITPNPRQPRVNFDEGELDELVGSIREIGVLQPVVVRQKSEGDYELIMGERRWRATREAGLDTIPAIIRDTDDSAMLRDALLENLHRSALNPLEEAAAYRQLLDDFECTHEELATRISRSRPQISNTLRLLNLPPLVQRRVAAGVLSAGHARALLGLSQTADMEKLAQRIVSEGLSVRATEEAVTMSAGGDTKKPVRRASVPNEVAESLSSRLSDRFDTRVKVNLGKTKGRLTVEFATLEDLDRILEMMAPEVGGVSPAGSATQSAQ